MTGSRTALRPLAIQRLGAGVARRLEAMSGAIGCVHSVFERAINVLCRDGRLVTIQGPGPLAAPFAASLDRALPGAMRSAPGAALTRSRSELRVDGIRIDLRGADAVCTAIEHGADPRPLAAALLGDDVPAGGAALRTAAAVAAQRALALGLRTGDAAVLVAGASPLIGLGEGLTPAGDDCLVGVLAVARRLRPDLLQDRPGIARAIAAAAETRTTSVAREFLLHAVEGSFSEPVIAAVSATSPERARAALRHLLACGATSGADTAAGMRLALTALGT